MEDIEPGEVLTADELKTIFDKVESETIRFSPPDVFGVAERIT